MTTNIVPEPAANGAPGPSRKKRANHLWLWFFLVLAVVAVGASAFLVWYNLSLQLKPDQLEKAWALWKEKGPKDYDLTYEKKGSVTDKLTVRVRQGKVVFAEPNTRPLEEMQEYFGMDALFRDIERFLKLDGKPGASRTYARARFDAGDGHLIHYVRRVSGTSERLEITVDLQPIAPEKTGR